MSRQKMTEEQKRHARILRYRQNDIDRLDKQVVTLRNEQQKYRQHLVRRFKWWLELQKEGSAPNLQWLIEDDAKFLNSVSEFSW